MSETIACFYCEQPVESSDVACRHCGRSYLAPACPQCGQPVSDQRSERAIYSHRHGSYAWNHDWNGQCQACGHEFAANLKLRTGHTIFFTPRREEIARELANAPASSQPFAGISELMIRGGESVYMECDEWDHQPTIELIIRREVAANCGGPDAGLYAHDRIAMTPDEWAAVIAQLQGPLSVLMKREPWSEDTT